MMRRPAVVGIVSAFVWSCFSPFGIAQQTTPTPASYQDAQSAASEQEQLGAQWFDRMVQALRTANFDATLVQVQGDRIEPLRWLHGLDEENAEVELMMRLNGPDFRVLRFGQQTAYYQPAANSYSLRSDVVHGLLPTGFYRPFARLADYYRAIPAGGARIVDRDSQHIRLVSRDNLRYGYSLWIDRDTGLLLKSAVVTPQGEVVEQLQLTSVEFYDRFPANLADLRGVPRPPMLVDSQALQAMQYRVEPQWLPQGFELRRMNHHQLPVTGTAADYFMFSDGLTQFSVYVAKRELEYQEPLALEGAESLYSRAIGDEVVTVVGALPLPTLKQITDNIVIVKAAP